MEIASITSGVRTTKVRTAKPAAPKSSGTSEKAKPIVKATSTVKAKAKPTAAAMPAPSKRKASKKAATEIVATVEVKGDITHMIAMAAYYLAEQRHFAPGYDVQDWLMAEQSIRKQRND